MRRPLFLLLGVLVILILAAVWVYILLVGDTQTPEPGTPGQFATPALGDTTDTTPSQPTTTPTVIVASGTGLQQLTTTPIAGFVEVPAYSTSTTAHAHYVAAGTGHVFAINLQTGQETRISGTTIPLTRHAVLTPNGQHLLLQAGEGAAASYTGGTIATSSESLIQFNIPETAPLTSVTATHDNEFLYTVPDGNNTLAKAYNPANNTIRVLFTIPFREVTIAWHHTTAGPHLVYPKASSKLPGVVYSYTNGARTRLPISGYGVSAVGSARVIIASNIGAERLYQSTGLTLDTQTVLPLPLVALPEKCAFIPNAPDTALCGITLTDYTIDSDLPDSWYRGELRMQDSLWEVNPRAGAARLLLNLTDTTGQFIDVLNPVISADSGALYFQNKADQTLWRYDLTI